MAVSLLAPPLLQHRFEVLDSGIFNAASVVLFCRSLRFEATLGADQLGRLELHTLHALIRFWIFLGAFAFAVLMVGAVLGAEFRQRIDRILNLGELASLHRQLLWRL